jgi:tetrahydromethanopterin S-methyltransferase subunit A
LKVSGVEVEKKSEEAINVDRIGLSEIEKLTQNLKPSFDLDKKKLKKKQVIVEDSTSEEEEEEEESEDLSLKKLKLLKLKSKIDKLLGEL